VWWKDHAFAIEVFPIPRLDETNANTIRRHHRIGQVKHTVYFSNTAIFNAIRFKRTLAKNGIVIFRLVKIPAVIAAHQPEVRQGGEVIFSFIAYYPWICKVKMWIVLVKSEYLYFACVIIDRKTYVAFLLLRTLRYTDQQPGLFSEPEYSRVEQAFHRHSFYAGLHIFRCQQGILFKSFSEVVKGYTLHECYATEISFDCKAQM
jgi:hypothetical protein